MTVEEETSMIETTIEGALDAPERKDARDTAKSRLTTYERTLSEVRDVAGGDAMSELATWLRAEIREAGPPSGRAVRQRGAEVCREHGETVSADGWLGV